MLKVDGCYSALDLMADGYSAFGWYLNSTQRHILYSCSWPAYTTGHIKTDYNLIAKHCNIWRNYNDIQVRNGDCHFNRFSCLRVFIQTEDLIDKEAVYNFNCFISVQFLPYLYTFFCTKLWWYFSHCQCDHLITFNFYICKTWCERNCLMAAIYLVNSSRTLLLPFRILGKVYLI